MQLKGLLVASVAVAAVSAQQFANNTCTACVFGSFAKNPICAKLPAEDMASLNAVFAKFSVDVPLLSRILQKPEVKSCVCDWSSTAFTANGAASECTGGAQPVCNASQVGEANTGLSGLAPILKCSATGTSPSAKPSGTAPTQTGSKPSPTGAASMINLPYALSLAAVGVAAFLGF